MDKTININIAGTLFQIDEEAFRILRDYLQVINNRFRNIQGGYETIDDIELRIAEIFQSKKGIAGVITKENVEAMIAIIGKPEDFDHYEPEVEAPTHTSARKRMYRNPSDSIISGVCGGIGAYLDNDPVLFRILFIIFTVFFGIGFFVYIALWIALPSARTEIQKREMYGDAYHSAKKTYNQHDNSYLSSPPIYGSGYNDNTKFSNALNEIFTAIGRLGYIILRVFLIIIGVALVLTGFLFILSYVMVFVFRFPGAFSIDSSGFNLVYFPDFLNYIVNPATVPWIIILTSVVFILPMLALIYWGVKMIFWFRANDGVFSLVGLVIWVMTLAALAIILFNEGISFAKTAKSSVETVMQNSSDTLYIMTDKKIADLKFEKEISLPHKEYSIYINDDKKELYIRPYLSIDKSDNKSIRVELKKRSAGRTELDAMKKIDGLLFNYNIHGDTLRLDEYFTITSGRKWSADNVGMNIFIPKGTILKFEQNPKMILHTSFRDESDEYLDSVWESGNSLWVMTDDGLHPAAESRTLKK